MPLPKYKQNAANIIQETTEDDFKDYAGENAYQFIPTRNKILEGKLLSWSWSAFILGPIWAGYRKYWRGAIASCAMTFTMGWVGAVIACILLGIFGKTQYVLTASREISKIHAVEQDPVRFRNLLSKKGGTSIPLAIIFFIINAVLFQISLAIVAASATR
jgi:hypothetical protein